MDTKKIVSTIISVLASLFLAVAFIGRYLANAGQLFLGMFGLASSVGLLIQAEWKKKKQSWLNYIVHLLSGVVGSFGALVSLLIITGKESMLGTGWVVGTLTMVGLLSIVEIWVN